MSDVGFCVVGLGMGKARAKTICETAGAKLVSVVDLNEQRAKECAAEFGCKHHLKMDDALGDDAVDFVMVMTPSGLHGDLAVQALNAGKHVITTKPMEVSLEKCDAMIAAWKKSGRILAVDFQRRYEEPYTKVKHAIDSGLFGQMVLGEARLKWYRSQAYYDAGGWRGTWKMDGGGALANQTIHEIDLLRWFMGKPKRVIGRYGIHCHKIETEDLGMAMIEFESGAVGMILGTTTYPTSVYSGLEVHGTEGGVMTTRGETQWHFLKGMEDRLEKVQPVTQFKDVIQNAVAAVRDGAAMICDGNDGRASIELLNAIYTSARNGSAPVNL